MTLRITPEDSAGGRERFRLEGSLAGLYVEELGKALGPSLAQPRRVALDLSGLTFVDAEGAQLLKDLLSRDVSIHGCSSFVAQLIGLP